MLISALVALIALFLGTSLLVAGSGLLGTGIALQAGKLGFSDSLIGAIMSAYFAGFVVGTYLCPGIVIRVGHIRAFSAFAACACTATLLHPLLRTPEVWALLRFVTGASMVGLYMVIESWLNERSTNELRGRIFAFYQVVSLTSLALGQYLILVESDQPASPFLITGALLSIGLVPVVLTRIKEPTPITSVQVDLKGLWRLAPIGVAGTLAISLCNGAFYAMGPVFAQRIGLSTPQIAMFMSLVLFGGVLLQWPIGHLSDRRDRRSIILAVSLCSALAATLAWLAAGRAPAMLLVAMFLYGGTAFSLYPLCVAHSNDHPGSTNFVTTATGLLLIYGIGATVGPVIVGGLMELAGAPAFLLFLIAMHVGLVIFVLRRRRMLPAPEPEAQEPFMLMSRTSQSAIEAVAAPSAGPEGETEP